jgi:hypothetical protein
VSRLLPGLSIKHVLQPVTSTAKNTAHGRIASYLLGFFGGSGFLGGGCFGLGFTGTRGLPGFVNGFGLSGMDLSSNDRLDLFNWSLPPPGKMHEHLTLAAEVSPPAATLQSTVVPADPVLWRLAHAGSSPRASMTF